MGSVDLIKSCLDSIRQISDQIKGAILYIDFGVTESFQFIGAFPLLLQLGARAVCSLENLSPLDAAADWSSNYTEPVTKAVIITSRLLSDTHKYILRCVGTHKSILTCCIFTSVPEVSHSTLIDSPLGPDAFREYSTLLTQDHEEFLKKTPKNPKNNPKNMDDFTPLSVSVSHFPTVICPVSSKSFVFPSRGAISEFCLSNESEESLGPGLPAVSTDQSFDADEAPAGASLTAHFLYYLADKLDLKLEIFSLGETSKIIGKTMMDMSSLYDVSRTKKSAGLLLIDRTIDLFTPLSHSDSFLDRILSSLPRQHTASSAKDSQNPKNVIKRAPLDIEVPFETILREEQGDRLYENIINFVSGWNSDEAGNNYDNAIDLSGKFLANYENASYLEALLDRGAKDGFLLVRKWLLETLKRENIPFMSKPKSQTDLHDMIKLLSKDQKCLVRNRGIIKLALAADVANSDWSSSKWDALVSAEKMLSISSIDSSQSLSSEIRDFINTSISSKSILSLKDALLLSLQGYILAGENFPTSVSLSPFSWEEERALKDAILDAIFENPQTLNFRFLHGLEKELEKRLHNVNTEKHEGDFEKNQDQIDDFDDQWGNWDEEEKEEEKEENEYGELQLKLELRDRIDQLFKFLQKLSSLRERNSSVKEFLGFLRGFEAGLGERKSLVYKLLNVVLNGGEIPGIEYHSSAVGRFFKSGFGRFGLGQAKPKFGDQNVLFVFVVGGINSIEIREVMEAITESGRTDTELILGGTTLLTPNDMFDLLLT